MKKIYIGRSIKNIKIKKNNNNYNSFHTKSLFIFVVQNKEFIVKHHPSKSHSLYLYYEAVHPPISDHLKNDVIILKMLSDA